MPEKTTMRRAKRKQQEGKAPTTQAGEFVREEMEHVKSGKHGVKSRKQAIAIGLSKARRAGVELGAPPASASPRTKQNAKRQAAAGKRGPLAGAATKTAKKPGAKKPATPSGRKRQAATAVKKPSRGAQGKAATRSRTAAAPAKKTARRK